MEMKFSLAEKKLFRTVIVFVLIQLLIAFAFIQMFSDGQPISIQDVKKIDVTVDDVYLVRAPKHDWLFVVSDSTKYLFRSSSTFKEGAVSALHKSISEGDELSLKYYEAEYFWGKANVVVDARTETETYRTIEEYNRARQGVPVFVVIMFSVIELVFVGIIFLYIWLNYNIIKGFYRKIKKHLFKKRTNRGTVL